MKYKEHIVVGALFIITILLYVTRLGGSHYIFITDLWASMLAAVALGAGYAAIKMYGTKSLQGGSLLLIVAGIGIWFITETVWIIFGSSIYILVESMRFLGYFPIIAGFFTMVSVSDPSMRKKRKNILFLFGIFLLASFFYLILWPVLRGDVYFWDNIANNGYLIVDFMVLFGVVLMLKTVREYSSGSLAKAWLLIAYSFISLIIFDIYFALHVDTFRQGAFIEVFWLFTYIFLAYGFYYQRQAIINVLNKLQNVTTNITRAPQSQKQTASQSKK